MALPPGLEGWVAGENAARGRSLGDLQMLGGLLGLQGQVQAQGQALVQQQRLADFASKLPEGERQKFLVAPAEYIKQMGEKRFSNIDPKDYTPESVAEFARTSNYAALVPVRKMEVSPAGDPYNPYTIKPGDRINMTSPHQTWEQSIKWPAQYNLDRIGHNASLARLGYETGIQIPQVGAPAGAQPAPRPQGPQLGVAPPRTAPQAAPQQIVPPGAPLPGVGIVTPKEMAERAAKQPQETAALNSVTMSLDNSITEADKLLKSPGLGNITGPVMGRTPNMTGDATNAQANLDTLKAQIGVRVLQAMREASKTGGAVGQVTEKEWPILQNQLGALQQSQTTGQFRANLTEVKKTLEKMKSNAVNTYQSIYGGQTSNNDPLGIR